LVSALKDQPDEVGLSPLGGGDFRPPLREQFRRILQQSSSIVDR